VQKYKIVLYNDIFMPFSKSSQYPVVSCISANGIKNIKKLVANG